jgi:hypothetical protein
VAVVEAAYPKARRAEHSNTVIDGIVGRFMGMIWISFSNEY